MNTAKARLQKKLAQRQPAAQQLTESNAIMRRSAGEIERPSMVDMVQFAIGQVSQIIDIPAMANAALRSHYDWRQRRIDAQAAQLPKLNMLSHIARIMTEQKHVRELTSMSAEQLNRAHFKEIMPRTKLILRADHPKASSGQLIRRDDQIMQMLTVQTGLPQAMIRDLIHDITGSTLMQHWTDYAVQKKKTPKIVASYADLLRAAKCQVNDPIYQMQLTQPTQPTDSRALIVVSNQVAIPKLSTFIPKWQEVNLHIDDSDDVFLMLFAMVYPQWFEKNKLNPAIWCNSAQKYRTALYAADVAGFTNRHCTKTISARELPQCIKYEVEIVSFQPQYNEKEQRVTSVMAVKSRRVFYAERNTTTEKPNYELASDTDFTRHRMISMQPLTPVDAFRLGGPTLIEHLLNYIDRADFIGKYLK